MRWAPVHQPGFKRERAQRIAHLFKCYTFVRQGSTSDDDHIESGSQLRIEFANRFAEPPFDAVALRGATDTPSDGYAVAVAFRGIGQDSKDHERRCPRPAAAPNAIELESPAQAKRASDHRGALALRRLLLIRDGHLPATSSPSCGENCSTTPSVHPFSKSVFTLSRNPLRLICPLHGLLPPRSQKKSLAERVNARSRNGFRDYTF